MRNKELARTIENEDEKRTHENMNYVCATFDLQQVLHIPKTEEGSI